MNKMEIIMEARFLDLTRAMDEYIGCGNNGVFTYNADEINGIDNQLKRICSRILGIKKVTIFPDGINSWRAEAIYENKETVTVEKKVGLIDSENFKIVNKGRNHSGENYTDDLTDEENKKIDELSIALPSDRTRKLKYLKNEYCKEENQR